MFVKSSACGNAEHKTRKRCSGKRDRTAYMSLPDFTERQLVSDYRLLEETRSAQATIVALCPEFHTLNCEI